MEKEANVIVEQPTEEVKKAQDQEQDQVQEENKSPKVEEERIVGKVVQTDKGDAHDQDDGTGSLQEQNREEVEEEKEVEKQEGEQQPQQQQQQQAEEKGQTPERQSHEENSDQVADGEEPAKKVAKVEVAVSLSFLRRQPSSQPRLLASSSSFSPHYLDAARGAPAYLKGCKFSPDGLCVLTASSDDALRIFEIPKSDDDDSDDGDWNACVTMKEGETVYDFCWHPKMDSACWETSCLLSTAQYQPIHLYDAYDGRVRATYRCFNHLDEMVAANSVAFDQSGGKIYAGLKHEVR